MSNIIPITKAEKAKLKSLFPKMHIPRTMKQKSKRHHYYAIEDEPYMRAIADTNEKAAEIVREIDKYKSATLARRRLTKGD